MEQKILPVVFSAVTLQNLEAIFEYGAETFSSKIAEKFVLDLVEKLDGLSNTYMHYAECPLPSY